jgi:hypothetical protein
MSAEKVALSELALFKITILFSNLEDKKNVLEPHSTFIREVKQRFFDKSKPMTNHWIKSINAWAENYDISKEYTFPDIKKQTTITVNDLTVIKRRRKPSTRKDIFYYQYIAEKDDVRYWFSIKKTRIGDKYNVDKTSVKKVNHNDIRVGDRISLLNSYVRDISDGIIFISSTDEIKVTKKESCT